MQNLRTTDIQKLLPGFHRHDTTKSEMIAARIDLALAPAANHVARAILIRAQERATPMHSLSFLRLRRIERCVRPLRIASHFAFLRQELVIVRSVPVRAPFPDISGHVVEPVAVNVWEWCSD